LKGRKPADRRVRVERPHSAYFRYSGPGQLVAKPAASAPKTAVGRIWNRIRAITIGRPLASEEEIGERLPKKKALAIFSSVAITLITTANLRGLRESGNIFAIPTYLFLGLALTMVGLGVLRVITGQAVDIQQANAVHAGSEGLGVFLLLKAFASGSVALTGT